MTTDSPDPGVADVGDLQCAGAEDRELDGDHRDRLTAYGAGGDHHSGVVAALPTPPSYPVWVVPLPGGSSPRSRLGVRGRLAVALGIPLVIAVLGAPLGLLWAAAAPGVPVVQTPDGPVLAQPQPEQFIAADGWFSVLGLGFGVTAAITVWLALRRYRGPVGLLVVGLGSVGAGLLAWQLGRQIGLAGYQRLLEFAPVGQTFSKPPDLRAGGIEWLFGVPTVQGALLLPAFGAVVTYTLLAGWSHYPSLRPEPQSPWPSWGSPVPRPPVAAPAPPEPGGAEPLRD